MNTDSFIIKAIIRFFVKLNYYYEYSLLCKILSSIYNAGAKSKIVQALGGEQKKDYGKGSLIIGLGLWVSTKIMGFGKWLYKSLAHINESSLNKKLFEKLILSLKITKTCVTAVFSTLAGVFAVFFIAKLGTTVGIVFGILCVICFLAGFVFPDFTTKAFKGSAPIRLIKWFFEES